VKLAVDSLVSTPENFALAVLATFLQDLLRARGVNRAVTVQPTSIVAASALLDERIAIAAEEILDLVRDSRAYGLLLSRLFLFPAVVSEQLGLPILVILDEFQDMRKLLNFPNTTNLWAIIRDALDRRGRVAWTIAGSIVTAMREIIGGGADPLFTRFEIHDLPPFGVEDTSELATRLWEQLHFGWDQDAVQRVHALSQGFPFYIRTIAMAAADLARALGDRVTADQVDAAFQDQLLGRDSTLAIYCGYLFEQAIGSVRGDAIPEGVLRLLAQREGQTPTDLARGLHRETGVAQIHRVVSDLRRIDILRYEGSGLWFVDPVLPIWIAVERERQDPAMVFANPAARARVTAQVSERLRALQEATGLLFERRVHNVLRQFRGQTVSRRLFGGDGQVVLPRVDEVAAVEIQDAAGELSGRPGSVELDGVTRGSEVWRVEAKHVAGGVTRAQIDLFARKCDFFARQTGTVAAQRWYVSNTGFRTEARVRCGELGILFTTAHDLTRLERAVAR
jgi:hypothetical protein